MVEYFVDVRSYTGKRQVLFRDFTNKRDALRFASKYMNKKHIVRMGQYDT